MKPLLHIKHLPTRSLTIDDEKDICVLLSCILKKRNIENICAHALQESISLLREYSFDLIFLDNYLPDGEGINFISYLKSYFPEVKIIFITAMMDEHIQFHINKASIDCLLMKPLKTDLIYQAIDMLFKIEIKHN